MKWPHRLWDRRKTGENLTIFLTFVFVFFCGVASERHIANRRSDSIFTPFRIAGGFWMQQEDGEWVSPPDGCRSMAEEDGLLVFYDIDGERMEGAATGSGMRKLIRDVENDPELEDCTLWTSHAKAILAELDIPYVDEGRSVIR